MAVTRKDVANAAGVSPAVVSYVVNGGPRGVATTTRKAVEQAIQELGYRPNRIAASLRRKQTHALGLIVPDNTNPYFAELAREIEAVAFAQGFAVVLGNAMEDPEHELRYVREFLDRQVDGLLLIPSQDKTAALREARENGTPLVVLDREVTATVPAQVVSDNVAGGALAATHLSEHGRTRIACIAGPVEVKNAGDRVLGWETALDDLELQSVGLLRRAPISRFEGRNAALALLREHPTIDGIFVASDEQAIGVLRALREVERECPTDVAVVSYDGTSYAALTTPGLTTVRQPIAAIADRGVRLLLDQQRQETWRPAAPIRMPVTLVPRGSCGCEDTFDSGFTTNSDPSAP